MTLPRPGHDSLDDKKRPLFRTGYAAHGVVYFLIGILAIDAALGGGGEQAQGSRGAITQLAQGTAGTTLLTLLALGLLGYAALRLWQGIANPANHDADPKGIGTRAGRIVSGLAQAALALYAFSIAFGWFAASGSSGGQTTGGPSSGSSSGTADASARILELPGGQWILGAVGVAVAIGGVFQLVKAVKASFLRELAIDASKRKWVSPLGRAGYAARFVVFAIAGGFVIAAAAQADPDRAKGLGGALRTLQDQPYGPWLLALTGAGLVAFALIRAVYARYAILPDANSTGS